MDDNPTYHSLTVRAANARRSAFSGQAPMRMDLGYATTRDLWPTVARASYPRGWVTTLT
jgi:hypothetical protein